MTTEVARKNYRSDIPEKHRATNDTRLVWLWNQRLVVVQMIFLRTKNPLDKLACALVLQATLSSDLSSIELLLRRLEGGAVSDETMVEVESLPI